MCSSTLVGDNDLECVLKELHEVSDFSINLICECRRRRTLTPGTLSLIFWVHFTTYPWFFLVKRPEICNNLRGRSGLSLPKNDFELGVGHVPTFWGWFWVYACYTAHMRLQSKKWCPKPKLDHSIFLQKTSTFKKNVNIGWKMTELCPWPI